MNDRKFLIYQGHRMVEGWPDKIIDAQKQPYYLINGEKYKRIPYGSENDDWEADKYPCHDCRIIKGQYHVKSCDVEQCPLCGKQALSCNCEFDL